MPRTIHCSLAPAASGTRNGSSSLMSCTWNQTPIRTPVKAWEPAGLRARAVRGSPRPCRGNQQMPSHIEDYALIGDCETAALVAKDGSIDWLCWPRFDSDACFAALLGTPEHGSWLLAPKPRSLVSRKYRLDTLILETRFECSEGAVTVIDFMPPRSGN